MDSTEQTAPEPPGGIDAVGVLAEPNRRALYEYVVAQRGWVSREHAAEAVGLGRAVTSHHLDRLAHTGLLDVDYRRLNERRGPGAGRPAKVYRRAPTEVAVTLPPRDYGLAGDLLARAAELSQCDGTPIALAIDRAARETGRIIGIAIKRRVRRSGVEARRSQLLEELNCRGFEPEAVDDVVVLHNCPFHQLAQSHTQLICGMNLSLLEGLLDELGGTGLTARLQPHEGYCCVRFQPAASPR